MLKLDYSYDKQPGKFLYKEKPFIHDLKPNFDEIDQLAAKYSNRNNIIVIGNGGAVNSFLVLYKALYSGDKNIRIINSMEPDLLNFVKKKYSPEDTLVITSSTSGTNVGVLEIMSAFLDYEMVVITAKNNAALHTAAEEMKLPILFVPHLTDRYMTSCALAYFPLAILGIDYKKIDRALHKAYDKFAQDGEAFKLSSILYELESQGYSEVFVPIYSYQLEGFGIYIMQLMHESVSKNNKSQTFIVVAAPESQHHTNQRFFGGQRNICSLFITAKQADKTSKVMLADELQDVSLKDGSVSDIIGVPLAKSFEFESLATFQDAVDQKIPSGYLTLDSVNEETVAELIAFWQYIAIYSSWLRDVNPFDQPQVEKSKDISYSMRKQYK